MAGFVDTTVLIDVAEGAEPVSSLTQQFARSAGPAVLPDYALRELLAGKVRILSDAHNRVQAASDPADAVAAVLRMAVFKPRSALGTATAVATALSAALKGVDPRTPQDIKREVLQGLMMAATLLWRNARRVQFFDREQPLSCFTDDSLSLDRATGTLHGPNDRFECAKEATCAAAMYMHQHPSDLDRLIDALHPDNLGNELAQKQENKSRRTALKELKQHGPQGFKKHRFCRALGDAYFALMAPPGSVVLTTNLEDHEPLCKALNKVARRP